MQISKDTINTNVADCFIASNRFVIKCRDINDVAISLYQVDISILIDSYKTFHLLAPGNMSYMRIIQAINLIIGYNTLIVKIVLIKTIRSQYKEVIASLTDALYLVVSQIIAPCTNLRICWTNAND